MGFEPTTPCDLVDALTTGLLETLWWIRVKCGSLTGTASHYSSIMIHVLA